ncbi:MAG: hypothetical protein AAGI48_03895 [Verrucomicrobiota bacterium]
MNTKPIFKSKTAWVNAVMLVASFLPPVQTWLAENPVGLMAVFTAVNVLVRFVTKDKVTLFPGESSGSGSSGGIASVLVMSMAAACLLGGSLLSSCSSANLAGYDIKGSIYYKDPDSGAKAGIDFDDGPRGFVKLPVYDEDTGEVIGVADVDFGPRSEVGIEPPPAEEVVEVVAVK